MIPDTRRRHIVAAAAACFMTGAMLVSAALASSRPAPPPEPVSSGRAAVIDTALRARLRSGAEDSIGVIAQLRTTASEAPERRAGAEGLRLAGAAAAADLLADLAADEGAGGVRGVRLLWLANAVAIEASPQAIREIASRADVRMLTLDTPIAIEPWEPSAGSTGASSSEPNWNLHAVHADDAWRLLGTDGTGTTIAVLDTGVDVHHPSLTSRYRGYFPSGLRNAGNWWCKPEDRMCGFANAYPVDSLGHGTHVIGTAVGLGGVGVAPGAQWMAARVCPDSTCELSWIIEALQWLLAPDGQPQMRPDVVNLSLGSDEEDQVPVLKEAIDNLVGAGVVVVASSGNYGGRVTVPGTYPSVITVGAVDEAGKLWPLSGRGLTDWQERKPELVAPGVAITSTIPGGGWAQNTGTSMAAPHVSGVVALLLQARPDLTPQRVKQVLEQTATPLSESQPDPRLGWGMVNAYAAVASVSDVGLLEGKVVGADGRAIPWARIALRALDGSPLSQVDVDPADGTYEIAIRPGVYEVVAQAFAFDTQSRRPVQVEQGKTTRLDFQMQPQTDMGQLSGWVYGRNGSERFPIDARVQLSDVPPQFVIQSSVYNGFSAQLPAGTYEVRVAEFGYRAITDTVTLRAGEWISRTYEVPSAPRLLLVDGDAWLYRQAIDSFRRSLDRTGYVYHEWPVVADQAGPGRDGGPPTAEQMKAYDVVIWSNNTTSPGSVGAGGEIEAYLAGGGRLFLTGQDVLCLDAGSDVAEDPCNQNLQRQPYVQDKLFARVLRDDAGQTLIHGSDDGPLAGVTVQLNGPGSLDNQIAPDALDVTEPLAASIIARYEGGAGAAIAVAGCMPQRAIVFGFGFEGIAGQSSRDQVMERVLGWLARARAPVEVRLRPETASATADIGHTAEYTVTILNSGSEAASVGLRLEGQRWPSTLWRADFSAPLSGPVALDACQQLPVGVRVRVPDDARRGEPDRTTVMAQSPPYTTTARVTLTTRRFASVLLVDGDFFTDSQDGYLEGLQSTGVTYDVWELGRLANPPHDPPPALLPAYPAIVWFTGYDWRPDGSLDLPSQRSLAAYLAAGGRLMFSSEDFLLIRGGTPYEPNHFFHQDYLGVALYRSDEGQAHQGPLRGAPGSAFDGLSGCMLPRKPPEDDLSDALVPRPEAQRAFLDVADQAVALQSVGSTFKSLFLAFDFGQLDARCADETMARAIDWLSPMHRSELARADSGGAVASGDRVSLALTLHNEGPDSMTEVAARWQLPISTTLAEVPPGWQAQGPGDLAWRGAMVPGEWRTDRITLTVAGDLPTNSRLESGVEITDGLGLRLRRAIDIAVNAPDLSGSRKAVADTERLVGVGESATFSVVLRNTGSAPAQHVVVTDTLPSGLQLVPGSVHVDGGEVDTGTAPATIVWRTSVDPGRVAAMSYDARVVTYSGGLLRNQAVVSDEFGATVDLGAEIRARPRLCLPILAVGQPP